MDISIFFHPVNDEIISDGGVFQPGVIGTTIQYYKKGQNFPDYSKKDVAIIGVKEDRNAINNKGCAEAPDYVRNKLYRLFVGDHTFNIVDLGNIHAGFNVEDTYFALSEVIAELIKQKTVVLIIGGGQDLSYANYLAY